MKISIVTVCFNSATTIADTLRSVAAQSYSDVEHIVVDGASSDETLTTIERTPNRITRLVSEADRGIYDAMNKGLSLATGDVVGFLNADDFYANEDVLTRVAATFGDPAIDVCFGDLIYVNALDTRKIVRYWKSCAYQPVLLTQGWMPPHPTFFVRRAKYTTLGGFDLNSGIAADAELMTRFLFVHRVRSIYIPGTMVRMRMGGTTNRSLSNVIRQNREIMAALRRHGVQTSWLRFLGSKLLERSRQFLLRPKA